jgi:hypothetical protein
VKQRGITATSIAILILTLIQIMGARALAHDPPPGGCGSFSTDVARELALMRQPPIPVTAASSVTDLAPRLSPGKHYAISLIAQKQVRFAASPGRAARAKLSRGGVLRFEVADPGFYRVSITSRHWIDVLDGDAVIPSVNHHGPGCDLLHKIVEFELTANRPLTLQLSGRDDAIVGLAITAVPPPSSPDRT